MKKFSVLEYLHPDGIAQTSLLLGSNCPEILRPELQARFNGKADLFIISPSVKEATSQAWLEAAVQAMSAYLSADGIGYVLVSPRWRWKIINFLRDAGLVLDTAFWHFPDPSSSRNLTPIERVPGQFFVNTIMPKPSWKRTAAMWMLRFWATRQFLIYFWNPVGISIRRPNARPLFQWMFRGGRRISAGTAILRTSWRGSKGANIFYGFPGDDVAPSVIAKTVSVENSANLNNEAKILENVAKEASRARMHVPKIIGRQQNDQYSTLLLSFLAGQSAADLLASQPDMLVPLMEKISRWLERWHRATVVFRPLTRELLERTLLAPAQRLAPLIPDGDKYQYRLMKQCEATVGKTVPLVNTHNDLTMANVFMERDDHLGILDWETGCSESFPLVDFYYAVTDAVQSTENRRNRLAAFKACYLRDGPYFTKVDAWREQLQSAIDSPPGFSELCFHACWLHHASNEQQVTGPEEPRPFLEIVQWLAIHESNFNLN
jgi:aminoglycoside phosphotransferase